jgi:hypothetical protein
MKLTTDIYLDLGSRGHGEVCILYPTIQDDSQEANILGDDSIGYCGEKEVMNVCLTVK